MFHNTKVSYSVLVQTTFLLALTSFFSVLPARSQATQGSSKEPFADLLPEGAAKQIILTTCTKCHNIDRIVHGHRYADQWEAIANQMINNGAALKKEDIPVLVSYLAENFPGIARAEAVVAPGPIDVNIKEGRIPAPPAGPHDPLVPPDGY